MEGVQVVGYEVCGIRLNADLLHLPRGSHDWQQFAASRLRRADIINNDGSNAINGLCLTAVARASDEQ